MKRIWLTGVSLSVIAAVAVAIPAVRGVATEQKQAGDATCAALTAEVRVAADTLNEMLKQPGGIGDVAGVLNGLNAEAWILIRLGCLPLPELAAPTGTSKKLPALPTPTASVAPPAVALPTVPVCTDLAADLMSIVWSIKAALLSTGAPDLDAALDAVTKLLDTLKKLTDPANDCLPAPAPANS